MSNRIQYSLDILGSIAIILFAAFLMVSGVNAIEDERVFYEASFFCYLGAVFVYAYYKPIGLVTFRGIIWICTYLSFPKGRFMALV